MTHERSEAEGMRVSDVNLTTNLTNGGHVDGSDAQDDEWDGRAG